MPTQLKHLSFAIFLKMRDPGEVPPGRPRLHTFENRPVFPHHFASQTLPAEQGRGSSAAFQLFHIPETRNAR